MFASKIRAAGQDRSPWGDFWFEPVSVATASGMRVSSDTAMQLSAVYRAVQLIAGHIAMLPMVVRRVNSLARLDNHWLLKLFKKPNAWQNGFEWRQMCTGHLLLRGNAYNEIISDRAGNITALMPRHPDRVKIEVMDNGDYRYRLTDDDGADRVLPRGAVWHLRGLSSNGYVGLSVIENARESLGLGLAAQSYGARFFANNARPMGGWIEFPGQFTDTFSREQLREAVQAAQTGANTGKLMVLDRGMKFHDIGVNNTDAQFLETRRFQISDIARWFGVPPHKLADLDRATFSNIEQQAMEYVSDSLLIWAEIWEAAIEDGLVFDDENLEVEFDFKRLTRGDSTSRAAFANSAIMAGWLTRNEARAVEGLEPIDGLDEPLRPLNMVEESQAENALAENATAPKGGNGGDTSDAPAPQQPLDDGGARLAVLLRANAERLARRIAKSGTADAELIASSLAVSSAAAQEWVAACDPTAGEEALTEELFALARKE